MRDYPIYTANPDNVGLYMLLAVKAEDKEKIYNEYASSFSPFVKT